MGYRPGDPYVKEFTVSGSTGAAVNADSLPTATANHNGTDDGSFTLTVTNLDAGRYKITGTVPTGYAGGDVVNVSIAATVGGIAAKAVVDTQVLDRPGPLKRGVAVTLPFWMGQSATPTSPYAGAGSTITATRSLDNAGFAACTNTPAQDAADNGWYWITLTAAETTATAVALYLTASGATPVPLQLLTVP